MLSHLKSFDLKQEGLLVYFRHKAVQNFALRLRKRCGKKYIFLSTIGGRGGGIINWDKSMPQTEKAQNVTPKPPNK